MGLLFTTVADLKRDESKLREDIDALATEADHLRSELDSWKAFDNDALRNEMIRLGHARMMLGDDPTERDKHLIIKGQYLQCQLLVEGKRAREQRLLQILQEQKRLHENLQQLSDTIRRKESDT